jgi:hypothetical protein
VMLSGRPAMPFVMRGNTSVWLRTRRLTSECIFCYSRCKAGFNRLPVSFSARRAKLKQKEAKAVGKSMKNLGRYGH